MSNAKGKAICMDEGVQDEGSSYESDSEDGDWHNFALMECEHNESDEKQGNATEDPFPVISEAGECSHKWPCALDLFDSGEDADIEEDMFREKPRPCVLQNCADEALSSVLSNKAGTPRDAPPVLDESVYGGEVSGLRQRFIYS